MALVAVVEDEQAISRLICLHLQSAGYEAKPYYTGDDFLRSLRTQIPDVLLLDWMLPGEHDGIGVLRQLRSHDKARTVPVIMLTAKGEELDRILGLEVGADDYLTKPFSFREMVSRVKAQLRRREWEKDDPTVRRHGVIAVYPNGVGQKPQPFAQGIRHSQQADGAAQLGAHARAAAGEHLGCGLRGRDAHGGHAHDQPAPQARGGRREGLHPDRARGGLQDVRFEVGVALSEEAALDGHLISRCGDSLLRTVLPLRESPVFRSAYFP